MTSPCPPVPMNVTPLPCQPSDGGSPGPIEAGCCSPSIALSELCLPDCSPISIVVRSGCAECGDPSGDPEVVGYVDAAGVFTPGAPPAGVGTCHGCRDESPGDCVVQRCQGFVGLNGPEEWNPPTGTEAVSINVICPPIVVYPCTGATEGVTVNECGSQSWAAPGLPCTPGELCQQFRIEIPVGSSAYISWNQIGCDGEVSP